MTQKIHLSCLYGGLHDVRSFIGHFGTTAVSEAGNEKLRFCTCASLPLGKLDLFSPRLILVVYALF
jgi:hypothetical protein